MAFGLELKLPYPLSRHIQLVPRFGQSIIEIGLMVDCIDELVTQRCYFLIQVWVVGGACGIRAARRMRHSSRIGNRAHILVVVVV